MFKALGPIHSRSLLIGIFIGVSTALGCAIASKPDDPPTGGGALPGNAQFGILFDGKGGSAILDVNGRPIPRCALPGTATREKLPPCRAITNTNLLDVTPFSVVAHSGSTCATIAMGGYNYTYCW